MPGFRAHYFFGKKTYIKQIESVSEHEGVYSLGQQGPDIFFYYAPSHFIYHENVGIRMHSSKTNDFFAALIKSRGRMKSDEDKSICDAYILGFMGHYTLDTTAHPYVHYRTKKIKNLDRNMYVFGIHVLLETDIDAEVLRHETGLTPTQFNSESTINLTPRELLVTSRLINSAIKITYPDLYIHAWQIRLAIKNTRLAQRLMHDETGIRKVIMRRADGVIFGSAVFSSLIANDKLHTYDDPCNFRHREWKNPWDLNLKSTMDFYQIMDAAREKYVRRADLYNKYITEKGQDSRRILINLLDDLGNCSYDTGLEIEE